MVFTIIACSWSACVIRKR